MNKAVSLARHGTWFHEERITISKQHLLNIIKQKSHTDILYTGPSKAIDNIRSVTVYRHESLVPFQ